MRMDTISTSSPHLLGAPARQLPSPTRPDLRHTRRYQHPVACVSAAKGTNASHAHTRLRNTGCLNGHQQGVSRRAQNLRTRWAAALDDTQTSVHPYLILYSKPGCHLCEGLKEKLDGLLERAKYQESVLTGAILEVRDITTREDWNAAYGMEIPVLTFISGGAEREIPRPPPRMAANRLEKHIAAALGDL